MALSVSDAYIICCFKQSISVIYFKTIDMCISSRISVLNFKTYENSIRLYSNLLLSIACVIFGQKKKSSEGEYLHHRVFTSKNPRPILYTLTACISGHIEIPKAFNFFQLCLWSNFYFSVRALVNLSLRTHSTSAQHSIDHIQSCGSVFIAASASRLSAIGALKFERIKRDIKVRVHIIPIWYKWDMFFSVN